MSHAAGSIENGRMAVRGAPQYTPGTAGIRALSRWQVHARRAALAAGSPFAAVLRRPT